ncbi:MAG: MFS transporter [Kineosporiaceae bacterium]
MPDSTPPRFGPGEGWGSWTRFLRERPRPARIREHPRAHWFTVGTVCVGAFMGQLDASIVTIGLPAVREDLGGSIGAVEWVSLAYLLTLVVLVLPVGRLADSLGRKSLYLYGFASFTLASLACGLAPGLGVLIAARVLQGAGAALLQANSVALIRAAVPREALGRAIGVQGAAQAVGLAVGPSVGGLLLALGSWRLLFLVAVPAGVLGWLLGIVLLPRSRALQPRPPADLPGVALFTPAVVLSLLGLSWATHGSSVAVPLLLISAGLVAASGFWWRERRTERPLLDPSLLRASGITAPLGASLTTSAALFGVLFVVPFSLAEAGVGDVATVGLLLSVLPVALGLTAPFAGGLADRFGVPAVSGTGAVAAAFGLFVLGLAGQVSLTGRPGPGGGPDIAGAGSGAGPAVPLVAAGLIACGVGMGLFTPANNAGIVRSVPVRSAGVVAGLMNLSRGLGTAAGVAVAALVYSAASGPEAGLRNTALVLAVLALAALPGPGRRGRRPGRRAGPGPVPGPGPGTGASTST